MNAYRCWFAALVIAPCLASAQPEEGPTEFEAVVVTGTRSERERNHLPAAVTVITREAIERSGARHLVEALRTAGGLQVSDLYGDGSRSTVDLRGFGDSAHSTTLILVDGRRLNNPDIAAPDLASVALKDVERIEIIYGSGGTLYGDQAVGGVINIITRAPQAFGAFAEAQGGSDDGRGVRAGLDQRWSAGSLRLSGEARAGDNYREHNALDYRNLLARASYDLGSGRVELEAGSVSENLETPGPLFAGELAQDRRQSTANFRDDFSDTDTSFVRLRWRQPLAGSWALDTDLTQRSSDGDFRLSFASGFSSAGTQDRRMLSLAPRLIGAFGLLGREALVTVGADALLADYRLNSDAFGRQTNDQTQRDLYAQVVLPLPGEFEATLGARLSRVENEPRDAFNFTQAHRFHDTQPAAEAGLAWQPQPDLRLFLRYDRNFRFAKIDEITNACAAPNSMAIDTQTGASYEAGAESSAGLLRMRLSAYRQDLDDEIAFDPTACSGFGANINLDRTRRDGYGADVALALPAGLQLDAAAHHVEADIRGGGLTGKDVPLVAHNTGTFGLSVRLPSGLRARLEAQAVDDRPLAGDFDNSFDRLPGFAVANAVLGASFGGLELGLRVNNLFDRRYVEYGATGFDATFARVESFFPSPERNFRLNAGYRW